jgi:hypothetical protein
MCVPPFYRFIFALQYLLPAIERVETLNFNEGKTLEYLRFFIMIMIQSKSNWLNIVKS